MLTLESNTTKVMEDNHGAVKLTNKRFFTKRTRHIDVKYMLFAMPWTQEGYV